MWITKAEDRFTSFKIVNLQKVMRIAFKAAKKVEQRLVFYYSNIEENEEVTLDTEVLCRVVEQLDADIKPISDTVRFQVLGTRGKWPRPRKKPQFFVGYSDEDGSFEKIAEVHLARYSPRRRRRS